MSPLIRPATPAPIVRSSPGGAIVRAPGGAAVPWVQRIATGIAQGVGALGIPGAAIAVPAAVGAATLPWVTKNWRGGPGAESMNERRGLTPTRRPMGNLPPSARVPSQYPAGVPTGVGGGNAGASTAAQWNPSAPPTPPSSPPGSWAPAAQRNPRLPAGRNVAIVNSPQRARNRALDNAAQNAGLPAWNWEAEENAAMLRAAESRGRAAATARGDTFDSKGMITSRGGGYLSRADMPAASNPREDAYWAQGDMAAWARANQGLAMRQGWDPNKNYQAAMGSGNGRFTTDDAILAAQSAGALDGLRLGATTDDAILAGQMAGAFDRGLGVPQTSPVAPAPSPAAAGARGGMFTTDDAILTAQSTGALDSLSLGATADDAILAGQTAGAFDQVAPEAASAPRAASPADEQRRRAAALSNSYLRAIQQHGMGLG
jgi:hypothetical protein